MIAGFKRVKALTKEVAVVAEALQGSNLLALDDSRSRIRRITPLPTFDASDIIRRTVVAEHLPDQPTIGMRRPAINLCGFLSLPYLFVMNMHHEFMMLLSPAHFSNCLEKPIAAADGGF